MDEYRINGLTIKENLAATGRKIGNKKLHRIAASGNRK